MRVIRRPAIQGHAIPSTAHRAHGPFPDEIMAPNEVVPVEDDTELDIRANAQNNYRVPRMMRCTQCGEVMYEDETDAHRCHDGA